MSIVSFLNGKKREVNTKTISIFIICLFVFGGFFGLFILENDTVSVSATTLYVGGSGSGNYTTIQAAIDNASSGDTVYVYPGQYDENLIVNKTINLIGANMNSTIINGIFSITTSTYQYQGTHCTIA